MADAAISDLLAVNTIRGLCMDAIQKANSGHPGTPMGIAPVAYTLWQRFLRFDPADPIWPNRDRFVLSEGHASALLWSLLHLTRRARGRPRLRDRGPRRGHARRPAHVPPARLALPGPPRVPVDERRRDDDRPARPGRRDVGRHGRRRRSGSRRATTATASTLFDYDVYALAGDGCMMEGISSEAASFAGHQGLSNLCWIYDSNRVTIEGHTDITFTEDVAARFLAYGWNVDDGRRRQRPRRDRAGVPHVQGRARTPDADPRAQPHRLRLAGRGLAEGARRAVRRRGREGDEAVPRDAARTRTSTSPTACTTTSPAASARAAPRRARRGKDCSRRTRARTRSSADEIERMQRRDLPDGWEAASADVPGRREGHREPRLVGPGAQRGRAGGAVAARRLGRPLAVDEDATLKFDGAGDFEPDDRLGRNLHFGIREHASAAIANGMALSKLRPYWSGFLIFSDYARGAIRLSALMEIPTLHIFTHDSIGVGEDGPTHQPVEQLASLRAMPGLLVFRPGGRERGRRDVAHRRRAAPRTGRADPLAPGAADVRPHAGRARPSGVAQGAYVLADTDGTPDVILLATGSEVALAMAGRDELAGDGHRRPRREHAVLGALRPPAAGLPDTVLPPAVKARVGDRAGVDARLGPLRRRRRRGDRHAHVRRVGTAEATAHEVRVHARTRGRGRARARRGGKGIEVKATELLNEHGQSLWLDNITRKMLDDGQIQRYIDNYSVTGLTSNPSIFDKAIGSGVYDDAIRAKAGAGPVGRGACSSSSRSKICAAPPTCSSRSTSAPTASTAGCRSRCRRCSRTTRRRRSRPPRTCTPAPARKNLFIKIPGTTEGLPAITESHRRRRAGQRHAAVLGRPVPRRGRRVPRRASSAASTQGLDPNVGSVASVFMSRWDVAVADKVPAI